MAQFVTQPLQLTKLAVDVRNFLKGNSLHLSTWPSAEVKRITLEKIADIDRKLGELQGLRDELSHLAGNCHGDSRPDCPIIGNLASGLAFQ